LRPGESRDGIMHICQRNFWIDKAGPNSEF
jgi:hypothetical protein